jgi:phage shock protein C
MSTGPTDSVPPPVPRERRLYRSRTDRMLAGVAGGLARYFGADPALVRVLMVAVVIFSALIPGLLLYLACVLIIPEDPGQS